jgi:putative transposase
MKDRVSRLSTIYRDDAIFFITCNTHERQKTLATESLHRSFEEFCLNATDHQIFVGRYVMMPDHLHLFVCFADAQKLPLWIKSMKNTLSKTLREQGIPAPHWQKGYFDHILRNEGSYEEKWTYVRLNPVRQELVENAEGWHFQGEITPLGFN